MPKVSAKVADDLDRTPNAQLVTVPYLRLVDRSEPRAKKQGGRPTNKELRPRGEYLTPEEVERLAVAWKKASRYGARDAFMIRFCARHGFRASELVELTWAAVELDSGKLHVTRKKNGDPALHYLDGPEIRELRRLKREAGNSRFVFSSERGGPMTRGGFQRIVEKAGVAAGFSFPVHPHMLRHACGYRLANEGRDTRSLAGYLGHKNMVHTQLYAKLNVERFRGW